MLSRRELMRDGLLLSTVGGFAPVVAAAPPAPAEVWVVDARMHEASDVAAAAAFGGTEVLTFTSDPGQVWMNHLEPRLRSGPFAVGGYTSASVLFCLHYLARDYGLTLSGLGEGGNLAAVRAYSSDALVDLRDPGFGNRHTAYTWLMLPGSA